MSPRRLRLVGTNGVVLFVGAIDVARLPGDVKEEFPLEFAVTPIPRPITRSDDFRSLKTATQVELLEAFRVTASGDLWEKTANAIWDRRDAILEELGEDRSRVLRLEIDFISEGTAEKIGKALRTSLTPRDVHGRWWEHRKREMKCEMETFARHFGYS